MISSTEIPAKRAEAVSRMILGPRSDHGNRACYVAGCRCEPCRGANRRRHKSRQIAAARLADAVRPNGPPVPGSISRGGREHRVMLCPGAVGLPCVGRDGGAWLRGGGGVCRLCVERHTVWDGLVDSGPAREHLLSLRRAGVGYKSVAAVTDVSPNVLNEVITGKRPRIRASTERRVLGVRPEDARADGALVDAATTNRTLRRLLAMGFARREVAQHLGYAAATSGLQLGGRRRCLLSTEARVLRLAARVDRGEVVPRRWGQSELVRELLARGVDRPVHWRTMAAEWRAEMAVLREIQEAAA